VAASNFGRADIGCLHGLEPRGIDFDHGAEEACLWVASFVDWYNRRHRHSGIKFVTPHQRHSGQAVEICRHRSVVYEQARQQHPRGGHDPFVAWLNRKWSGSTRRRWWMILNQLSSPWLPERQQGRHLSWQSPVQQGIWGTCKAPAVVKSTGENIPDGGGGWALLVFSTGS
jgi:hypothetical protein